jgi:TPR repeat protein
MVAAIAMAACHPGNEEAKRLRSSCAQGNVADCNQFALRLQKGRYVLRDDGRAAELFDQACKGGVGDSCASLGVA